jgi:hypothetical protein
MVLYAANIDLEKPLEKIKQKRISKKKIQPEELPMEELKIEAPKPAPKQKPKQKRAPKKEIKIEQEVVLVKEEPPAKKTRKRKQAEIEESVEEPKEVQQAPESPTLVDESEKPKKTRKIKVHSEPKESREATNDPPEWFKKYVAGVQKEKASSVGHVTKKQEKEIKTEALKTAHKSWQSGVTRDRVQGEVDSHMGRMYSIVFSLIQA